MTFRWWGTFVQKKLPKFFKPHGYRKIIESHNDSLLMVHPYMDVHCTPIGVYREKLKFYESLRLGKFKTKNE